MAHRLKSKAGAHADANAGTMDQTPGHPLAKVLTEFEGMAQEPACASLPTLSSATTRVLGLRAVGGGR
jgi:hypothetical protein